jgi:hypothetical protein
MATPRSTAVVSRLGSLRNQGAAESPSIVTALCRGCMARHFPPTRSLPPKRHRNVGAECIREYQSSPNRQKCLLQMRLVTLHPPPRQTGVDRRHPRHHRRRPAGAARAACLRGVEGALVRDRGCIAAVQNLSGVRTEGRCAIGMMGSQEPPRTIKPTSPSVRARPRRGAAPARPRC